MDLIAIEQARRLVQERFPDALSAILAGSTVTDSATTTSDLDIAVLLGDHGVSQRDTTRFEGRLAELFVHTRQGRSEVFARRRRLAPSGPADHVRHRSHPV